MYIKIGFELVFDVPGPVQMLLMLNLHPEQAHVLQRPEELVIEPRVPVRQFTDVFGNRVDRILAPAGKLRLYYENVAFATGEPEPSIEGKVLHAVDDLPAECLQFLLPSRYCEVDRLTQMAWDLFGKTPATWERVKAVVDWAHGHITFGYPFASPTKTAYDVCEQKQGVCRDYMHLAITMLRAMNVPARYATGYLGDIGVPPVPSPMDFSAVPGGVPVRPVVGHGRPPQQAANRPPQAGPRAGRGRRRSHHQLRTYHPGKIRRLDRRGDRRLRPDEVRTVRRMIHRGDAEDAEKRGDFTTENTEPTVKVERFKGRASARRGVGERADRRAESASLSASYSCPLSCQFVGNPLSPLFSAPPR